MKKTTVAAGLLSAAMAVVPAVGVFAVDPTVTGDLGSQTEQLQLTVNDSCVINSVTHNTASDTTNVTSSAWTEAEASDADDVTVDTLAGTMMNGTTTAGFGSTDFVISCNNTSGVSVTTSDITALTGEKPATGTKNSIPFAAVTDGEVGDATSSAWSLKVTAVDGVTNNATGWQTAASNGIVTSTTPVANATFTVTYGVTVSKAQAADTYTGGVTYTIARNS